MNEKAKLRKSPCQMVLFSFRLPDGKRAALRQFANEQGIRPSVLVRQLVEAQLANPSPLPPTHSPKKAIKYTLKTSNQTRLTNYEMVCSLRAVERCGGMEAAGRALHLSSGAIRHHMVELRERVGGAVVVSTRGVGTTLTPLAYAILEDWPEEMTQGEAWRRDIRAHYSREVLHILERGGSIGEFMRATGDNISCAIRVRRCWNAR